MCLVSLSPYWMSLMPQRSGPLSVRQSLLAFIVTYDMQQRRWYILAEHSHRTLLDRRFTMQAIWTILQVILLIVRFGKLPLIWTLLANDIGSARGQDDEASEAGDRKNRVFGGISLGAGSHPRRWKHPLPPSTPPPPPRQCIPLETPCKGNQNPPPC